MELVRCVRIGVLAAVFAIPAVVLIVANTLYFPFITGKGFAFRLLVELAFAGWVVLALADRAYRPTKSVALWLGLAFVVSIGLSTILAENPTKAFWSNFERMEGYVLILHLAMYVVVLTSMLRTERLWRNLIYTTLGVAVIVGMYSVFQLSGAFVINQGGLRIDATLGNATYFAVYMLVHVFLALYALVRWARGRVVSVVLGILALFFSVLVMYSATRGAILGLLGGLALAGLIVAFSKGVSPLVRRAGYAALALVIVLSLGFVAVKDTQYVAEHPIFSRIASISLAAGETRFTIWSMALEGVAERPMFGWGQEGFNYVFNEYYRPELVTQEPWFDRAHNVVLDWLVAGGFLGMLLYLSLYAVLIYYLWRGTTFDAKERAILTGLIAAYGFHNLFVFDNLMSYVLFLMVFSYITVRANPSEPQVSGGEILSPQVGLPVVAVFLIFAAYFLNAPGYASASGIIQGLSPQPLGVQKNLQYFREASERSGLGYQEVGEQFLQFAIQARAMQVGDERFRSDATVTAQRAFESILAQAPNDARLLVFYATFLRQVGDLDGATRVIEQALQESPKKQSILVEAGTIDLVAGRFTSAVERLGSVYASAGRYGNAHLLLAAAHIRAGSPAAAKEILIKEYGSAEPPETAVATMYLDAGQYDAAVRIAELAAQSNSLQALQFLAGVYYRGNQFDKAITALSRAKQVAPEYAAQADELIRMLSAERR